MVAFSTSSVTQDHNNQVVSFMWLYPYSYFINICNITANQGSTECADTCLHV